MGTYNAVDELHISGTLAITVASAVLGTCFISLGFGHSTVLIHGHKVQSPVETAAYAGDVYIKRELIAEKGEHLVLGLALHEVKPAANVGAEGSLGHKLEAQLVIARRHSIGGRVVGTFDTTLFGTGLT